MILWHFFKASRTFSAAKRLPRFLGRGGARRASDVLGSLTPAINHAEGLQDAAGKLGVNWAALSGTEGCGTTRSAGRNPTPVEAGAKATLTKRKRPRQRRRRRRRADGQKGRGGRNTTCVTESAVPGKTSCVIAVPPLPGAKLDSVTVLDWAASRAALGQSSTLPRQSGHRWETSSPRSGLGK